jgi:glycerophosphoryl diester phosphodiesterase
MGKRPLIYAHRGARTELPENTMAAFQRAAEVGADALELDVHMTLDGVVVVAHDPDMLRVAGISAEIRRSPWSIASRWDLGKGCTVPSLEGVLDSFRDLFVNIDVKQTEPDMVPATLRAIRRTNRERSVRITSFSSANLRRIAASSFAGSVGVGSVEALRLLCEPSWSLARRPLRGDALQVPRRYGALPLDARYVIGRAHKLGIRVDYWTINDPSEARLLVARGADGIVTDDPRTMVAAFAP